MTNLSFSLHPLHVILSTFINSVLTMQTLARSDSTDIFTRNSIDDTFYSYLDEFNIKSLKEIVDNDKSSNKEKILLATVRDFKKFSIDLDLMISILGMLWIIDVDRFDPTKQTEVERLCFEILDLQWYLRNNPDKDIASLRKLLNYYQQNKEKIKEA